VFSYGSRESRRHDLSSKCDLAPCCRSQFPAGQFSRPLMVKAFRDRGTERDSTRTRVVRPACGRGQSDSWGGWSEPDLPARRRSTGGGHRSVVKDQGAATEDDSGHHTARAYNEDSVDSENGETLLRMAKLPRRPAKRSPAAREQKRKDSEPRSRGARG
jgi:hypothetical protein